MTFQLDDKLLWTHISPRDLVTDNLSRVTDDILRRALDADAERLDACCIRMIYGNRGSSMGVVRVGDVGVESAVSVNRGADYTVRLPRVLVTDRAPVIGGISQVPADWDPESPLYAPLSA